MAQASHSQASRSLACSLNEPSSQCATRKIRSGPDAQSGALSLPLARSLASDSEGFPWWTRTDSESGGVIAGAGPGRLVGILDWRRRDAALRLSLKPKVPAFFRISIKLVVCDAALTPQGHRLRLTAGVHPGPRVDSDRLRLRVGRSHGDHDRGAGPGRSWISDASGASAQADGASGIRLLHASDATLRFRPGPRRLGC